MIRVRWKGFELPARVTCDPETRSDVYGRFIAEPFERGFGVSVGSSLRRVLLSSIEGAAVTAVRIEGVSHEFSVVKGVGEDVPEMILNIKGLVLKLHTDEPRTMRIEAKGKREVTAADIQADADVEIVNKEHHIASLARSAKLVMEMEVRKGRGYVPASEHPQQEQTVGLIPVDALFSPVQRVAFRTEDTRVGRRTNYDRLLLEIWTNGTVTPEMALVEAAKVLRKHLNSFVHYFTLGGELVERGAAGEFLLGRGLSDEVRKKLQLAISDLDLSIRAYNCLTNANVNTVAELVTHSEDKLLSIRNFGNVSLKEVKKKLEDLELHLGMALNGQTQGGE